MTPMMMPTEIAQALDDLKTRGRLDEWFVTDYPNSQRDWFITLSGARTSIKYTRREVEAFLLGASLA